MKNVKRFTAMGLATLMALTMVPTVGASDEAVTLDVMHYYTKEESDQGDNTRKMPRETILEYDELNEDVTLNISEVQHDDYQTKLQALAAADDLPDVFFMKGSWVGNFYNNCFL